MSLEYSLLISGRQSIPEALDAQLDLAIHCELNIYAVEKRDKQDGDFEIVYKAKASGEVTCIQGSKKIVSTDKRKMSQKLRGAIYHLQNETENLNKNEEEFYESTMRLLISNLGEIYNRYKI